MPTPVGAPDSGTANVRWSFTQDPAHVSNNASLGIDGQAVIDPLHGLMHGGGSANNFAIGSSATLPVHTWSNVMNPATVAFALSMGFFISLAADTVLYTNPACLVELYDIWVDLRWNAQGITQRYRPTHSQVTTGNPFDSLLDNQAAVPAANYANLAAAYDGDPNTFATLSLSALIMQTPFLSGNPVAGVIANFLNFALSETFAAVTDPQLILRCSDDGGLTFGVERQASMGKLGNYSQLARWRQLGRSRDRVFEVICSEPVDVALIAADLDSHG